MLNKIVIQGRLVADPEMRTTRSGVAYCNVNLAVERNYGKREERVTDFLPVVLFRQSAEFVEKHCHKGDTVLVEGALYQEKYQTKDGQPRSTLRISAERGFLCGTRGVPANATPAQNAGGGNVTQMPMYGGDIGSIDSDELPF